MRERERENIQTLVSFVEVYFGVCDFIFVDVNLLRGLFAERTGVGPLFRRSFSSLKQPIWKGCVACCVRTGIKLGTYSFFVSGFAFLWDGQKRTPGLTGK